MAYPSEHFGSNSNGGLRAVVMLVVMFLVWCFVAPRLYSKEGSNAQVSCPCDCDCYEDFGSSLPLEFLNSSFADCGKHDPYVHEEMKKNMVDLLSEEIDLHKTIANDSLKHNMELLTDAKKTSLHYKNEAEKCNAQTETCEEARERAEAELAEERKLSALWEQRAHELGWRDS